MDLVHTAAVNENEANLFALSFFLVFLIINLVGAFFFIDACKKTMRVRMLESQLLFFREICFFTVQFSARFHLSTNIKSVIAVFKRVHIYCTDAVRRKKTVIK